MMRTGRQPQPRTCIVLLIRFAFSVILLACSTAITCGQNAGEKQGEQRSELAKRAETCFQEAVLLAAPKEQQKRRLRLMEARRLWMQIHEPEKAARACLQIGDCYKQDRAYQESLYYYNLALEVSPSVDLVRATAFMSMAQIYLDVYETQLSEYYFNKALTEARAAKDAATQAQAWAGLANLYHQTGESEQAMACIAQARQLNRLQQNEAMDADLLRLAGLIDQEKGRDEPAQETFEEAIRIYQKLGDEENQIRMLCLLSDLYLISSQKQEALETGKLAVKMAEKRAAQALTSADIMRGRDLRWRASLSQARAQRAVGQKELAVKSYQWAIHQVEGLYWTFYIATEVSAAAFRQACLVPYLELVDLLVEQGDFELAYGYAQQVKARAMMGLIEGRRTADLPKKPEQEEALREIARAIARQRAQLVFSKSSRPQQAKIQQAIEDLEYKMREMQLRVEMEQSRHHLRWSSRPSVKQLQEQMAQEKFTILDFLVGQNRSFIWVISSNHLSLGILPGKKELEKNVNQYLALINTVPNNLYLERDLARLKERAESLFSVLFGQLSEPILPGQKLVIVPDGLLHYLPFEALVHNNRYLIEDHEISYAPSTGLLVAGADARGKAEPEDKMELLAFGDPVFGPLPKKSYRKADAIPPGNLAQRMRAARGFQLEPLPQTRDEVKYISGLFPAGRQRVYLGKESTERALKQETLRRYRRIHFATHSLVDERSASRSAVVLSVNADPDEDGFLEVDEITALDLDSDLVVLSACQTGHGQMLAGEGIVGLCRAFLYAGTRCVVVSLWSVSDISTSLLMKTFYQRLVTNLGNAAALRDAKLYMVASGLAMRHPYYWAPFVLVGRP